MGGFSLPEQATTDRQQRILDTIRAFTAEQGYPPSVREIGERVGLSSSSTVQSHLKTLERRGLLRRDPTKPRALVASDNGRSLPLDAGRSDNGKVAYLPIVGKVAAGVPITAIENVEDTFALPVGFVRDPNAFILKVSGDSMVDAAILDGDLVVVKPAPDAKNGEIVVAMLDGEATVKRFYREPSRIRLQPENRAMAPIYADDVTIVGRVEAVIRKL
jgi:repressor LexA